MIAAKVDFGAGGSMLHASTFIKIQSSQRLSHHNYMPVGTFCITQTTEII